MGMPVWGMIYLLQEYRYWPTVSQSDKNKRYTRLKRGLHLKHIHFFIHPLPLFAVVIMATNDHYLKAAFPGLLTGKLSDFAGMFYFPIFVAALVVLVRSWLNPKSGHLCRRIAIISILFADILLVSVKLRSEVAASVEAFFARVLFEIEIVPDPTDLLALSMNVLSYLFMRRYFTEPVLLQT